MGAMCSPLQSSSTKLKPVTQQEIDNSTCKQLIYEYLQFYGRQASMQLVQWIERSYDKEYTSNIMYLNYPSAVKLKRDLYSSFQTLHNGGWTAKLDKFTKISKTANEQLIMYEMICNGPSAPNSFERKDVKFKVISMFTAENKFKTSIFKQIA